MAKRLDFDERKLEELLEEGKSFTEIALILGINPSTASRRTKQLGWSEKYKFKQRSTDSSREKCAAASRKRVAENPEKHPLRVLSQRGGISVPCQRVKDFLTENGVLFADEFNPGVEGRKYKIDIALPDKFIAIEVNGNQHYEADKQTLAPYYQERHDAIAAIGWKIYEIPVRFCFKFDKDLWRDLLSDIRSAEVKQDFDFESYRNKQAIQYQIKCCVGCGVELTHLGDRCAPCNYANLKKPLPGEGELVGLLKQKPILEIAKDLGVGRQVLGRHIKEIGLEVPPKSFWHKAKVQWPEPEELQKLINENNNKFVADLIGVSPDTLVSYAKKVGVVTKTKTSEMEKRCPSREFLEMLLQFNSFTVIAKIYGVFTPTITRWVKYRGLYDQYVRNPSPR